MVGAGDVALSRIDHLLVANAKITVVSGNDIHPTILKYEELGLLEKLIRRNFKLSDLIMYEPKGIREKINAMNKIEEGDEDDDEIKPLDVEEVKLIQDFENLKFKMILTCVNNYPLSLRIWQQCKILQLDVNLADKPKNCDFYFGSIYRQGPLQIMISTNGKSPRLCNRIKNKILVPTFENLNLDKAVENLGYLRNKLRNEIHPGEETEIIKERMEWNKKITDFYTIQEWCEMEIELINKIVTLYPNLPTLKNL